MAIKYAALFANPRAECFFPYKELLFDTKSEAKSWGRKKSKEVQGFSDLQYSGRVIKIDGRTKYPKANLQSPDGNTKIDVMVCICGGELYKELTVDAVEGDLQGAVDEFIQELKEQEDAKSNPQPEAKPAPASDPV